MPIPTTSDFETIWGHFRLLEATWGQWRTNEDKWGHSSPFEATWGQLSPIFFSLDIFRNFFPIFPDILFGFFIFSIFFLDLFRIFVLDFFTHNALCNEMTFFVIFKHCAVVVIFIAILKQIVSNVAKLSMEIAKCNYESRWALEGASALKNCNQESFFKVQAVITSIEMKIQGVPKGFVWFAFQIINEDSKKNRKKKNR